MRSRQVSVTAKLLQEYKQMIEETTSDLQELWQKDRPASSEPSPTVSLETESSHLMDERSSVEACPAICARVSEHIDQVQEEYFPSGAHMQKSGRAVVVNQTTPAGQMTSRRLENWKVEAGLTSAELRIRLGELNVRMSRLSQHTDAGGNSAASTEGVSDIREGIEGLQKCLRVVEEATEQVKEDRVNIYEDNKVADRGDQVVVSTSGDLITAKRFEAGTESMQMFSQMSDDSYRLRVEALKCINFIRPVSSTIILPVYRRSGSEAVTEGETTIMVRE